MAGSAKPCRPANAGRLVIGATILAAGLLLALLPAAPLAAAAEQASVGVNVESTEGSFKPWHYEVSYEELLENEDVSEKITTKFAGGAIEQIQASGISFAKIAELGGLPGNEIEGMTFEQKAPSIKYTLTPAEIVGFSDGIEGDSDPVMAVIVLGGGGDDGANLEPVFPWQAGREQERFTTGTGKEVLVLSIKVKGRVLTLSSIKASPAEPEEGQAVTFSVPTVELEGHPDGQVKYEWNFGDGKTSTEASPTHHFAERGAYSVSVSVRDQAEDAQGTAHPLIVHVTEKPSATPKAPPTKCKGGGSPPCGEAQEATKEATGTAPGSSRKNSAGAPHGSSQGTTSGSPHRKHAASAKPPLPKAQPDEGHGGGEGNGVGTVAGVGLNGGRGGGPGGGTAGGNSPGTGAKSGSGHAEGTTASELAGSSAHGAPSPHDGAIDQPDTAPAPTAQDAGIASGRLVGYIIDPSSAALPEESGSQGGGVHPNASLLAPGGTPGNGSADEFVTWLLIGAGVLACIGLGTFSEIRPRRKGGRVRISGARS